MAGYNGFSMSNNAVDAYDDGKFPLSKLRQSHLRGKVFCGIKTKFALWLAKNKHWRYNSWHHTSGHYNKTYFYCLEALEATLETLGEAKLARLQAQYDAELSAAPTIQHVEGEYSIFGGSVRRPKYQGAQRFRGILPVGGRSITITYLQSGGAWVKASASKRANGAHITFAVVPAPAQP